jgi:hypothetical protein
MSLVFAVKTNNEQNALWRMYESDEPDLGINLAADHGEETLDKLLDKFDKDRTPYKDTDDGDLLHVLWAGRQQDKSRMGKSFHKGHIHVMREG